MKKRQSSRLLTSILVFGLGGCASSGSDSTAVSPTVDQGRQAIGELRNWATQVNQLKKSQPDYSQELQIADSTGQASESASQSLLIALAAVADAYMNGSAASYDLAAHVPTGFTGTATGTIKQSTNRLSITNGTINGDNVNVAVVFPNSGGTEYKLDILSAEVSNAHAYTRVDKGRATVKYATTATNTRPDSLATELQVTVGEKDSGLNSQFTGQLIFEAKNYQNARTGERATNISHVLMGGAFKNDLHSFNATFDVHLRNAGTFVGATPLQLGHQHKDLASYSFAADGQSVTIQAVDEKVTYGYDATTQSINTTYYWGEYSNQYSRYGSYSSLQEFLTTASLYEISFNFVAGEGHYILNMPTQWDRKGGTLDGTLASPSYGGENVNMWRDIDGSLRLGAKLDGLPGADIVLSVDRTAYAALKASIVVAYDNVEIKLEGDGKLTNLDNYGIFYGSVYYGYNPQPGVQPTGIKLTVTVKKNGKTAEVMITLDDKRALVGTVKVDGSVVGTIKPDPKTGALLVTYVDGSFETVGL